MDVRRCAVAAATVMAMAALGNPGMARARGGGFYVTVTGLLALPRDSEMSQEGERRRLSMAFSMKPGVGVLAAAGYRFRSGLQAELELGYRRSRFGEATRIEAGHGAAASTLSGKFPVDGRLNTLSLMANGTYSLRMRRFRPYAGLGLGLATHMAKIDPVTVRSNGAAYTAFATSDNATVFAYQAMAGLGYRVTRRMEIRLGYRYFATLKPDFGDTGLTYGAHNVEAGLLYRY